MQHRSILCIVALFLVYVDATSDVLQLYQKAKYEWPLYKMRYNLSFSEEGYNEDEKRFNVFANNYFMVERHNDRYARGLESFNMAINEFSYMTMDEFSAMNGFPPNGVADEAQYDYRNKDEQEQSHPAGRNPSNIVVVPKKFDWRSKGIITGIRAQGKCGSCWAFATIAGIEAAYAKKYKKLVDLSEQQLLDCITRWYRCNGCRGGLPSWALKYFRNTWRGVMSEKSYPYKAKQQWQCHYKKSSIVTRVENYWYWRWARKSFLQEIVYHDGPAVVLLYANNAWRHYKSGIFDAPCSRWRLNHAVLVVGYTEDTWIIKNSWGAQFGEKGYIRLRADRRDLCGVCRHQVVVPQVVAAKGY